MDTSDAVLQQLMAWGKRDERIEAMLLTSTRAMEIAALDRFSDYDVILVTPDSSLLLNDEDWINHFGEVLVRFNDHIPREGYDSYTRLVLYEDGVKIDFSVWPVALLNKITDRPTLPDDLDIGYRVLLDKSALTNGLSAPTFKAYIPSHPTETEYLRVVNNFWWDSTYVVKNLCRDDLVFAKYMLDVVMRFEQLQPMLEWHVQIRQDWQWRAGVCGKYLKRYLEPALWAEVETTFTGPGIEDNWQALFKVIVLFRKLALEVGEHLGLDYPQDLDRRVMGYLERVRASSENGASVCFG
jgi:aminoglycoside 6-adenylyltransferase